MVIAEEVKVRTVSISLLAAALVLSAVFPANAQNNRGRTRVQQAQDAQVAAIPGCVQGLGSLSIIDAQPEVFRELRLSPPETLLRVVVQRPGCFTLVDRGVGMDAAIRERAPSGDGMRMYPAGTRHGLWWETLDDNDYLGRVQNNKLAPGR